MKLEPTVLIDGAVPHDYPERSQMLLNYATDLSSHLQSHNTDDRFQRFQEEVRQARDTDAWIDLEDEIIDLIEDMLPDDMCVDMPQPGDVIVMSMEECV